MKQLPVTPNGGSPGLCPDWGGLTGDLVLNGRVPTRRATREGRFALCWWAGLSVCSLCSLCALFPHPFLSSQSCPSGSRC